MRRPLFPWQLLALFALALALRAGAGAWIENQLPAGTRFIFGDSDGYWRLGQSLARDGTLVVGEPPMRVFRAPGYPLCLATLFTFAGEDAPVLWGRFLGAGLSALAILPIFWLGQRLFDDRVGLLAGLIVAIYPGAVMLGAFILSEAPFCALVPLQLLCWHNGWFSDFRNSSLRWLFLAGAVGGLATLVRPSWLLFTPAAILFGLVSSTDRRRQLTLAPIILLGLVVAMAPWWLRNYVVVGRFVPTTLQFGASLYDGLNPNATGASNMDFVPAALEKKQANLKRRGLSTRELEARLDYQLRRDALAWTRDNPGQALRLAGVKFLRMWNLWPNDPAFRSTTSRLVVALSYVPLLVLGLAGVVRFWRGGLPYALCLAPAVYLGLMHLVFIGSLRYREPAMILLAIPAAAQLIAWTRDPLEPIDPPSPEPDA